MNARARLYVSWFFALFVLVGCGPAESISLEQPPSALLAPPRASELGGIERSSGSRTSHDGSRRSAISGSPATPGETVPALGPAQPKNLPSGTRPLDTAFLERRAEQWCKGVGELAHAMATNLRHPPGAEAVAAIAREQKLASKLCLPTGKFRGYPEVIDPDSRAWVETAAVQDGIAQLVKIAELAGSEMYPLPLIYKLGLESDFREFRDPAIREIWSAGEESRVALTDLLTYGRQLNEWYRHR